MSAPDSFKVVARTFGSLNAGDIGCRVRLNDSGFVVTGTLKWAWHKRAHKGEPQTLVQIALTDGEINVTRPAFTEIEIEAATE